MTVSSKGVIWTSSLLVSAKTSTVGKLTSGTPFWNHTPCLVCLTLKTYNHLFRVDPAGNVLHPSPFSGRGLDGLYGSSIGSSARGALREKWIVDGQTSCTRSVQSRVTRSSLLIRSWFDPPPLPFCYSRNRFPWHIFPTNLSPLRWNRLSTRCRTPPENTSPSSVKVQASARRLATLPQECQSLSLCSLKDRRPCGS